MGVCSAHFTQPDACGVCICCSGVGSSADVLPKDTEGVLLRQATLCMHTGFLCCPSQLPALCFETEQGHAIITHGDAMDFQISVPSLARCTTWHTSRAQKMPMSSKLGTPCTAPLYVAAVLSLSATAEFDVHTVGADTSHGSMLKLDVCATKQFIDTCRQAA